MLPVIILNEPRHVKTCFLHNAKTKLQISCAVTSQLISAFVFATSIDSTIPLLLKSEAIFCGCIARFAMDLHGNREDRFSHDAAHIS